MIVTVDINVLLDVFQKREPHYAASASAFIITRNVGAFVGSRVPAISPTDFLSQLPAKN